MIYAFLSASAKKFGYLSAGGELLRTSFIMLLEEKCLTFATISMLELQLEARNMLSRSFTLFHLTFCLLSCAGLLSLWEGLRVPSSSVPLAPGTGVVSQM